VVRKTNNVYGQVVAPDGLRAVFDAAERVVGPGCASLFHARAGGPKMLRIRTDAADLESIPLPGGMEHLLNGAVGGSTEEVAAFVRALSASLTEANVEHAFEVHDGKRIVLSLPE
jgi:hypothetical protein